MSIQNIGFTLDQVLKNITALMNHADALPDRSTVTNIVGGNEVTSEQNITKKLEWATTALAGRIDRLREFVRINADALNAAAQGLQQNEADNSLSASDASAFINNTAASAPAPTSSSSSTHTPPASNATSSDPSQRAY
ncbi:hypothetical protein [Microbacterium sp. SORGH_AS_0888]|uniref:hypothetical protein n=1 Tax=Microbacterium sp. SORGH_AS_0888 TaxID=3041791 RepID=UPI00277E7020|nr:hypothetical protein [Microbacterium sp. SORGH_AS_0888]MDQ1129581.1 hypothetical protein [Microbacterium sp. SORGH_AS_0888]